MDRIDIRSLRRSPGRVAVAAVALVGALTAAYFAGSGNAAAARAATAQKEFVFPLHPAPVPVPALVFEDSQGRKHSLADFRGKLVLLNLWATWCVPCRKEMPTLDRLQQKLGGPGFQVVALSIDQGGVPAVKRFFDEIGVRALPIYVDAAADSLGKLRIVGVPTTLLIDRDGRELGRVAGAAEWDSPEVVSFIRHQLAATGRS